jgi:hypothetical protein
MRLECVELQHVSSPLPASLSPTPSSHSCPPCPCSLSLSLTHTHTHIHTCLLSCRSPPRSDSCPLPSVPLPHRSTLVQIVELLLQITRAVKHMHANGIAHCDLKFENVLYSGSLDDLTTFVAKVRVLLSSGGLKGLAGREDQLHSLQSGSSIDRQSEGGS